MLAKGLDFDNVSLVGIINADICCIIQTLEL
jgi:primosomal protein N'